MARRIFMKCIALRGTFGPAMRDWHREFWGWASGSIKSRARHWLKVIGRQQVHRFFGAFTYFRSAERVLPGDDERKVPMYHRAVDRFRKGLELSGQPHERIIVSFDGKDLEGYFYPARNEHT